MDETKAMIRSLRLVIPTFKYQVGKKVSISRVSYNRNSYYCVWTRLVSTDSNPTDSKYRYPTAQEKVFSR